MRESFKTRVMRWGFNWFPAFRGTGGRITFIASDFSEIRVKVPLSLRTRNYVGTIFGGSMYGAVDPIYMIMLIHRLGPRYIVWDKAASIRFLKPGRKTLFATFRVTDEEVEQIETLAAPGASLDRHYLVELVDADGTVCAQVEKTLYIKRKHPDARTDSTKET
jgi:acyl-coenzyme A thioesterase PaaI-like protein